LGESEILIGTFESLSLPRIAGFSLVSTLRGRKGKNEGWFL
jgi:hypothetical protein